MPHRTPYLTRSRRWLFSAGFTLIEMLIVTSIMMVILGGGIAAYINFNEKQQTLSSARELQKVFRSAQVKARAGEKPATCEKLEAFLVEGQASGNVVQLTALCAGVNPEVVVQTINLNANVVLDQDLAVEYKTLHGGVSGAGQVGLSSSAGTGYQYVFVVDEGGSVSTGEFLN